MLEVFIRISHPDPGTKFDFFGREGYVVCSSDLLKPSSQAPISQILRRPPTAAVTTHFFCPACHSRHHITYHPNQLIIKK